MKLLFLLAQAQLWRSLHGPGQFHHEALRHQNNICLNKRYLYIVRNLLFYTQANLQIIQSLHFMVQISETISK